MASERALTEGLARLFPKGDRVLVGIGDDAAVVRNPGPTAVLCCDPVVAGVHFDPDADPRDVGRKAVNRNLSDLAAMGARPDFLLLSLVLPRGWPAASRRRLLLGIQGAAYRAGARVVGGDVAVSDGPLTVTVTAVGHPRAGILRRSGLRAGDTLHASGPLGGAALGHHLRFEPELALGEWLARPGTPVRAAIDVSDGLLLDLATMLRASDRSLGAELEAEAIPVSAAAARLANGDAASALRHALTDGEDHVLLFSVAKGRELPPGGPLKRRARRPIGVVLPRPGIWLRHPDGRRERLRPEGYQHGV
ncbi:MAG: thiamine-phosphate kinase [Planctomycetota bacterium]